MNTIFQTITGLEIFSGFSENQIKDILTSARSFLKEYRNGEFIHRAEQPFNTILFLCEGVVEGTVLSSRGKVLSLERMFAPSMIAPAAVFSTTEGPFSIEAVEDTIVLCIQKDTFFEILKNSDVLLKNFLAITSNRFIHISRKLMFHSFHSIEKKIALYLLQLYEKGQNSGDTEIQLPFSITELAHYFGVERPSLSKVLNDLIRQGFIARTSTNRIKLVDRKGLENIIY